MKCFQTSDGKLFSPSKPEDAACLRSPLKSNSSTTNKSSQQDSMHVTSSPAHAVTSSNPTSPAKHASMRLRFPTPAAGASKLGSRPPASFGRAPVPAPAPTPAPTAAPPQQQQHVAATVTTGSSNSTAKESHVKGQPNKTGRRYLDFDNQDPQTDLFDSWASGVSEKAILLVHFLLHSCQM